MAMGKTKSGHAVAAVSEVAFRNKRNPETYPRTPSFLVAFCHCDDLSHYNDIIRPSGADNTFSGYSEGIMPNKEYLTFFSRCY